MKQTQSSMAFVFPGQGSQQVGMLKAIAQENPLIEQIFQEASKALGKDLWNLAQHGQEEDINLTTNTQPLLLTAGVSLWRLWQAKGGVNPGLMAGHSLGEYTALVCSQAMSLADGVQVVAKRAQLMQEAVPQGQGAMAAILGLDNAVLAEVCQQVADGEVVAPANFNANGQTVIAAHTNAVTRACELAKTKGAKKAIVLPVSVPSHCALMQSAAEQLSATLASVKIATPVIPIVHNVDVETHTHPDDIRDVLVKQLFQPVRWVETLAFFTNANIDKAFECGPGKVLSALIKRTTPQISTTSLEAPSAFDEAVAVYA